ncbi:MAG TPA: helix-turn-helix transcriptional regulator [Anaeromyxobacter sp.]
MSPLQTSRIARGLTQEQVAVRAGIAGSTVRRLEAGAPLSKDAVSKLAKTLDATPEEQVEWLQYALVRAEQQSPIRAAKARAVLDRARARVQKEAKAP